MVLSAQGHQVTQRAGFSVWVPLATCILTSCPCVRSGSHALAAPRLFDVKTIGFSYGAEPNATPMHAMPMDLPSRKTSTGRASAEAYLI